MKRAAILFFTLITLATPAYSTFVIPLNLTQIISRSDQIVTVKILSGKCELSNCRQDSKYGVITDYTFMCKTAIYGSCPKDLTMRSAASLCIGCSYMLLHNGNTKSNTYFKLELRNLDTRVVFEDFHRGIEGVKDLPLRLSEQNSESSHNYHYYDFKELRSAILSIKKDYDSKN